MGSFEYSNQCRLFPGCSGESFIVLIKKLVKYYSLSYVEKDTFSIRNKQLERSDVTKLIVKAYETIFSHRKEYKTVTIDNCDLNEIEKLIWHSYILRKKKQYDKANKLDKHLKSLQKKGCFHKRSDVYTVLQLLCHLTDAASETESKSLSVPAPWIVSPVRNEDWDLPSGPLDYNDTRLHHASSRWHYTHYPCHLFQLDESFSKVGYQWTFPSIDAYTKEPGAGQKYSFFCKDDESPDNCLGALVGPKKSPLTPDTILSIPELPSLPQGYSFVPQFLSQTTTAAKSEQYKSLLSLDCSCSNDRQSKIVPHSSAECTGALDEGYGSSQGSCIGKSPSKDPTDIWEEVLELSPLPNHRTWESLEKPFAEKEKPFISEAGDEVVQKLWAINHQHLSCAALSADVPNYSEISLDILCKDIIHLLIGVPSSNFIWNKVLNSFEVKDGVCYRGMTPESFRLQAADFITCGNQIVSLEEFTGGGVSTQACEDIEAAGLVLKSVTTSVKDFLYVFRNKVLSFLGETRVLCLKLRTEKLMKKVSFVYDTCASYVTSKTSLSKGLSLIGALQIQLPLTQPPSHFYLMLSLLNAACQPFFRFFERWIYEGELYDPGSEFMVSSEPAALAARDRLYWVKGYSLRSSALEEVSQLLKEVLTQAFQCGKSLSFLRVCSPQNYLLWRHCTPWPRLRLCLSVSDIETIEEECQKYKNELEIQSPSLSLAEYDKHREEKLQQLIVTAMDMQKASCSKVTKRWSSYDDEIRKKKNKEMERIKADMKQAMEWKEMQRKKEEKENLQIQFEYERILRRNDEKDMRARNDMNEHFKLYAEELEKREAAANQMLQVASHENMTGTTTLMKSHVPYDEKSPETPREEDAEPVSHMSLTSDQLETPNEDIVPDISKDSLNDNVSCTVDVDPSTIKKPESVNNNNSDDGGNTETEYLPQSAAEEHNAPTDYEATLLEARDNKEHMMGSHINSIEETYTTESRTVKGLEAARIRQNVIQLEYGIEVNFGDGTANDNCNNTINSINNNIDDVSQIMSPEGLNANLRTEFLDSSAKISTHADSPTLDDTLNGNVLTYPTTTLRMTEGSPSASYTSGGGTLNTDFVASTAPSAVKISRRRPVSENVEHFPEEEEFQENFENSGISIGQGMRKSRSDTFSDGDRENVRNKNKLLQSSLFSLNENEKPVLIDMSPDWDSRGREPSTRFRDEELLKFRVQGPTVSLRPYERVPLWLSAHQPIKDITGTAIKGSPNVGTQKDDLEGLVIPSPDQLKAAPVCFVRALSIHVLTQTHLVNKELLSHLLITERLLDHFYAIKSLILLHDASFARALTSKVFNKFDQGKDIQILLNPVDVNGLLSEAIFNSVFADSPFAHNLSFVFTNSPSDPNRVFDPFSCIELQYRVKWPVSVILDETVITTYGRIWRFLAKLHYVMWAMDDLFRHMSFLSTDPVYERMERSLHFHQLSLFRHEMHQFVRVIFGYVSHQGILGGWAEFQSDLRKKVVNLDDLYVVHWNFINSVMEKCFLTPQASVVHDLLQDIFSKVLTFRSIMRNHLWRFNATSNRWEHTQFISLHKVTQEFKHLAQFVIKLIMKFSSCSVAEHIDDLVDQLNFNVYDPLASS